MFEVGDLVIELTFGREWYERNPWMVGEEIGVIISVCDVDKYEVYWQDSTVTQMTSDLIQKIDAKI